MKNDSFARDRGATLLLLRYGTGRSIPGKESSTKCIMLRYDRNSVPASGRAPTSSTWIGKNSNAFRCNGTLSSQMQLNRTNGPYQLNLIRVQTRLEIHFYWVGALEGEEDVVGR